jgi:hypothetical protein
MDPETTIKLVTAAAGCASLVSLGAALIPLKKKLEEEKKKKENASKKEKKNGR